jgi:hypothetical protein
VIILTTCTIHSFLCHLKCYENSCTMTMRKEHLLHCKLQVLHDIFLAFWWFYFACIHNLLSTCGLSKTWIPLTQHQHLNPNPKKNKSLVPPKDTLWMNLTTFHPFQPLNKLYFTTKKNVFLCSSLWCILMFMLIWGLCTIVWFYFLTRHVAMKGSQ